MIQPEPEGSTQGYPLVSVEVLSHGPSDAKHNPPLPLKVSQQTLVSFLTEITRISIDFLTLKHPSDIIHSEDGNPASANIKQAHGRFYTLVGNPIKEILFKLNLPDHRSILTDLKEQIKMEMEYMFQDFRYSDTVRPSRSDEVLKLKNFEKDASLQLSSYQIKKCMSMSVPKSQVLQDGKKRLCLVDDLIVLKITYSHTS
ncbi:hypothetical protein Tco_0405517 [Tanacetum coccineum]